MGGCCSVGGQDGEAAVPQVKKLKQKGCTDFICLVIFAIFVSVMIFISAFAFVYGNPERLINGYDSFGNVCGQKGSRLGEMSHTGEDMTDKKYVFFQNVSDIFRTLKLCVRKCPDVDIYTKEEAKIFGEKTGSLLCRYDVPLERYGELYPFDDMFKDRLSSGIMSQIHLKEIQTESWRLVCPHFPVYQSVPVLNRCVPKATNKLGLRLIYNIHAYLNDVELFQQIFSDFYASWDKILGLTLAAFVLSFLVTISMYLFTFILSWIFMIVLALSSIGVTVVLWYTYADSKNHLDNTPTAELLEESVRNEQAFLVFSIIATVFTIVLLLVMFAMRKHIQLLSDLFREASKCIREVPCLLLQPLWTSLVLFGFFVFWVCVMLSLATANVPVKANATYPLSTHAIGNVNLRKLVDEPVNFTLNQLRTETAIKYESTWVQYTWWFFVIALIWVSEFILACQQMVIAGATCFWYFERNKQEMHFPIFRAFRHLFLYHLGTLAFGSFLITMLKIPRLILAYIEQKLKKYKEVDTCYSCAHCCVKCCFCCFWALEKFVKYVNHNAYTIVVYKGYSFCPSAKIAFETIMSNILKVTIINSVGDAILFFGKCAVTALMAFIGLLVMKHDENLHFYAVPIFVVCVFTFFIAHCFLSVFEMVVDTLLLCYCEDYGRDTGDGDVEPKHFASESLQLYLERASSQLTKPIRTDPDKDAPIPLCIEPEFNKEQVVPLTAEPQGNGKDPSAPSSPTKTSEVVLATEPEPEMPPTIAEPEEFSPIKSPTGSEETKSQPESPTKSQSGSASKTPTGSPPRFDPVSE